MKVGFDAGPLLGVPTGVGRYARELLEALRAQGAEMVPYAVALKGAGTRDIRRWRLPARSIQRAWRSIGRPRIEALTGPVDVVHATNFVLPPLRAAAGVVTVHDLSFLRDDTFPGGPRLRELVPWSLGHAAGVITPTRAIADEVIATYGVADDQVWVTHEGVAPAFFGASPLASMALERLGIRGPFVLAVGTIEPRKNLATLLKAWPAVRAATAELQLVIAGPAGWGPELPETDGVHLLGWTGDETLPGLFAAARAFCYPSLYEGFGLPPLEAMAAGTPAVVGAYPAAAEVLGDAAVLVDPLDHEGLAAALVTAVTDESKRRGLVLAGRARASSFTWEATAGQTLRVYRAMLDS